MCVAITDAVVWYLTPTPSVYDVIVVVGGGEAVMCTNSNNCDSLNAIASAPGFFTIVKSGRNSGGGKCRTQHKFCIGIVPFIRSFVCSLFQAHFSSKLNTALAHWIRPQPWRVGRVQCEENCLVVWWSHFYWFSIFSKDLCFMNAFSLSSRSSFSLFLQPAFSSLSTISDLNPVECFFFLGRFRCCLAWIVAGAKQLVELNTQRELAIFRYVYALFMLY